MDDLTGKQLGQYRIVSQIGRGGMATVYKAYQPRLDRDVALKILPSQLAESKDFFERFRQEAKLIASLEHVHILPVYDYGEEEGYPYIAMRYVEYATLAEVMRQKLISLSQACKYAIDIASALDYAHQRGVMHRDIKPSNILLDKQGHCYLTDFGLAKIFTNSSHSLSRFDAIVGTPAYISPEQAQAKEVDHRTDIYSLGIVLYEMATGSVPFLADTPMAVIFKHIADPLPLPRIINPALPESVEKVILKALAKNPTDRFATAGEMAQALSIIFPTLPALESTDRSIRERLRVFLCHSSSDKPVVRSLYDQLKTKEWLDPWLDQEKLLPGQDWNREISQAVKDSDCIIVCLSHGSINKEGYVQKEISLALYAAQEKPEGTIYIIPLKLEECKVPYRLHGLQWLNYFEKGASEKLLLSLKKRAQSLGINVK